MESKLKSLLLKKARLDGQAAGGYRQKKVRAGNLQAETYYDFGIGRGYRKPARKPRNPANVKAKLAKIARQADEISQAAGVMAYGMKSKGAKRRRTRRGGMSTYP